jgi:hypothetical protein
MDLLRGESGATATLAPSNHTYLFREVQTLRALAIRHALVEARFVDLDALGATNLLVVRTAVEKCADPQVQITWKRAVENIGMLTASYLNPTELADVWNSIKSTPCYRDTVGEHKVWADLLAVVAARNATEIVSQGKRLLDGSSSLSRTERTYLTSAIAAAYLGSGQTEEARNLFAAQWSQLDLDGEFSLSLREMLALAAGGNNTARANGPSSAGGR